VKDRFLELPPALGRTGWRSGLQRRWSQFVTREPEEVGLDLGGDGDVPLANPADHPGCLVGESGDFYPQVVEPFGDAFFDDLADAGVDAVEEPHE
jgi:hypothetical protein